MKRRELIELLGISDSELESLIAIDDDKKTRTVFRKAMAAKHPDNLGGNDEQFMTLRRLYKTLETCSIRNIVDDYNVAEIVFDIDETRGMYSRITDIMGNEHDRRNALCSENCKVRLRMTVTIDGWEFPVEWKTLYRLDNKYTIEIRPRIPKEDFLGKPDHVMKVVVDNTYERLSSEISWKGFSKELGVKVMGDRLIVSLRVSFNLVPKPSLDEEENS